MQEEMVKRKIMKRILMAVTLTLMALSMFGQQRGLNDETRHGRRGEEMKSALALTDDQVKTINAIQEKYHGKMVGLRRDSTLSKEQRLGALKDLNGQRQGEINNVLTTDQQEKWKSIKQENRGKRKEMHAARKNFREELDLTSEQEKRISDERKKMRDQAEALKKDESLSREQKQEKFKSLRAEHETAMKAILTPEQFAKWKERPKKQQGKPGVGGRHKGEGKHYRK